MVLHCPLELSYAKPRMRVEKGLWDYFAVVLSAEGTMRLENVDVEVIVVVLCEKGDDSGIQ